MSGADREVADRSRSAEFLERAPRVENRKGLREADKICPCGLWRPKAQNGCERGQFCYWHHNESTPKTGVKGKSTYVPTAPNQPKVLPEAEFRVYVFFQAKPYLLR
jgi:hypothetical protein